MHAEFSYIGKITSVRFKKEEGSKRRAMHFSIVNTVKLNDEVRPLFNNNMFIPSRDVNAVKHKIKIGNRVYLKGFILTFSSGFKKQYDLFFVTYVNVLSWEQEDMDDIHINKYGDLPPEEIYDVFDESTDEIEKENPFKPWHEEDREEWTDEL